MISHSDKPGKIAPAICAAMGAVKKLGKAERNAHGGYNFTGIDQFLEMVNPILAANGLIVMHDEASMEEITVQSKNGSAAWLRYQFDFWIWHVEGETTPKVRRSIELPRTGAQTAGSAQSYAVKQFLRGLLLIPTGDKDDADFRGGGMSDPAPTINADQFVRLQNLLDEAGADEKKFCDFMKIDILDNLPASKFAAAEAMLKKKAEQNKGAE